MGLILKVLWNKIDDSPSSSSSSLGKTEKGLLYSVVVTKQQQNVVLNVLNLTALRPGFQTKLSLIRLNDIRTP